MRRLLTLLTIVTLAAATGCGRKDETKAPAAGQGTGQAAADAVKEARAAAGLCKEHGVLEPLCTKCNPALAPVFQAKGDWCADHGFPKSVCPICYPERGGRPAVDVSADDAPADGTKVILKGKDTARLAGIETARAVAGRGTAEIVAPVVISYDAGRVAQVTARAPGVVKRVSAEIGSFVSAGATLAVIESAAVSGDQSRVAAARSRVQMAQANHRREAELEKKGISARKEVQEAQQAVREASAELEALQASLRGMGAGSGGRYIVKAPVSGVVTQRTVSIAGYVDSHTPLFEIVDTSVMWGEVAIAEAELGNVKSGMQVAIVMDGLGGREFRGTIANIAPIIDPQTRTAKARVRLPNGGGMLRANMYGQARIAAGGSHSSAVVPQGAVQRAKSVKLAFVRLKPDEFEARRVQVVPGSGSGDTVEIASGVEPGEEIVVAGSFLLKTETLKDSIGAGCCEVETK